MKGRVKHSSTYKLSFTITILSPTALWKKPYLNAEVLCGILSERLVALLRHTRVCQATTSPRFAFSGQLNFLIWVCSPFLGHWLAMSNVLQEIPDVLLLCLTALGFALVGFH